MVRRGVVFVALVVCALGGLSLFANAAPQSALGVPTIRVATAMPQGVTVSIIPPATTGGGAITGYQIRATPLRGTGLAAGVRTSGTLLLSPDSTLTYASALTNNTVYQVQVAAINGAGQGEWSALSNTFVPAASVVPALDPTVTYVLPSWSGLISNNGAVGGEAGTMTVAQMAARLRALGDGPKAKVGLSVFVQLTMPNWSVDLGNPVAMRAALAQAIAPIDTAIANAKTAGDLPVGISLITAIRERVDGVERDASLEDWRNVQWYADQTRATGWMSYSQYAQKMRRVKEAYVRAFGALLKERMEANPNILVAVTGDGEIEMTNGRFRAVDDPSVATRSWGDYSPFAVAEFRDWLRGTGAYAAGGPLEGQAFQFASRYGNDSAPNGDSNGDGHTFNTDFGTNFTTWDLAVHNYTWSQGNDDVAGRITSTVGGATTCSVGTLVSGYCVNATGFDAPRPDAATILDNTTAYWQLFRVFREQMVHRYNRDFAQWVTEGTVAGSTIGGGVPYDRWYSAQIPTDVLFGTTPTDLGVRHLTSGSPYWSADIWPFGGMGVTGYNANANGNSASGSPGNSGGYYNRTVSNVAPLVTERLRTTGVVPRWSIVEWNPSDPWSTCANIYRADNLIVRQYRPALVMPFKIDTVENPTSNQYQRVFNSGFEAGLRELLTGDNGTSAPANCANLPDTVARVATPGIAKIGSQIRGGWTPIITWAAPAPILANIALSSTQLNATANVPGTFVYEPAAGELLAAGTRTLSVLFTPTDTDYATTQATVTVEVRAGGGFIAGTIRGRTGVSPDSPSVPLEGAEVRVIGGRAVTTGPDGTYTLGPLPGNNYVVHVSKAGYMRQVMWSAGDALCSGPGPSACPGGGVTVVPGQTLTQNIVMHQTRTLTGRVIDAVGNGLNGVPVRFDGGWQDVTPTTTSGGGFYTLTGLYGHAAPRADEFVGAGPTPGFAAARPVRVSVTLLGNPDNVNFTLAAGGAISGTVRGALNALLNGVRVAAFSADGREVSFGMTTNGAYTIPGLPAGSYYIKASASSGGYVDQMYPGRPCDGCAVISGDTVAVVGTTPTTGINFALSQGGSITGTVTDAMQRPLPFVTVHIVNRDNQLVQSGMTDAQGGYVVSGLLTGSYWARTSNSQRLVNRIYKQGTPGGVDCLLCGPNAGTPIAVTQGLTTRAITFVLPAGGSIAGEVTGAGNELIGAAVEIYTSNGQLIEQVLTDQRGLYRSTVGLPAASYYLRTRNGQGFNDEAVGDFGCASCVMPAGNPVPVGAAQDVSPISFALIRGGIVRGTVTNEAVQPVGGVVIDIVEHGNRDDGWRGESVTRDDGTFTISGVPGGGVYVVKARGSARYLPQQFCVPHLTGVSSPSACLSGAPTPFGVTNGVTQESINMVLRQGGTISGTVRSGGVGVEGVIVEVFTQGGRSPHASATTLPDGTYETLPLAPGTYYLRTNSGDLGYLDVVFGDLTSGANNPQGGTGVALTGGNGAENQDFSLVQGGRIKGRVTDGTNGIPRARVQIYSDAGGRVPVASAIAAGDGTFTVARGLAAGKYFAVADADGFVPERHAGATCVGCVPQSGTEIQVTLGAVETIADFTLSSGGLVRGVVNGPGSLPLRGIVVEFYDAAHPTRVLQQAQTDTDGRYVTVAALPAGTSVKIRTRNTRGLINEVAPNSPCLGDNCRAAFTLGNAVVVGGGAITDAPTIELAMGARFTGAVTRQSTGAGLEGVPVEIYHSSIGTSGGPVFTTRTNHSGGYLTEVGFAPGTYFLRTRNTIELLDKTAGDRECAPCFVMNGTGVAVTSANATVNFSLGAASASIAGQVRVAPSTGIADITVGLFSHVGSAVKTTVTDSAGRYRFQGLKPGTYFLKSFSGGGADGEVFNDLPSSTRITSGTPVLLDEGEAEVNRDFVVARATSVLITWSSFVANAQQISLVNSGTGEESCVTLREMTTALGLAPGTYSLFEGCDLEVADRRVRRAPRTQSLATFTVTDGTPTRVVVSPAACIAPTFSTTTLGNAKAGVAYSQAVTASGGTGGLFYSVVEGALAPGLSLNASTGSITGTPTASGASLFTMAASDANGCTALQDLSMAIAAADSVAGSLSPASLQFGALKNGTAGAITHVTAAQTVSLSFAPGLSPAWTATSSQPWLQLSATSGTGAGSFTASIVNPSNVIGESTSLTATITVTGDGISNRPLTLPVTLTIDQTNGAGTFTPGAIQFGATKNGAAGALTNVTEAQTVSLNFNPGLTPTWTVSSNQSWLQLSTSGGTGSASFTASIVNPGNVIGSSTSLTAMITVTGLTIGNGPLLLPVTLTVDQNNGATPSIPFGQVDTPVQNAAGVVGAIGVTGWALDNVGVASIQVFRNCLAADPEVVCQRILTGTPQEANVVLVGDAAFLAGARPDVQGGFSTLPLAHRAGWGMLMMTPMLPDVVGGQGYGGVGPLTVYVVATDVEGNKVLLGRSSDPASGQFRTPTSITMANDTIAKPFGSIDTPTLGQTISGVVANFGWALTPDSNTTGGEPGDVLIPTNGSSMWVFVDDLPVEQVIYNQCRGTGFSPTTFCNDDVSNIFGNPTPQPVLQARSANLTRFRNLDMGRAPIGAFLLNTTTLRNGLHTIAWSVTDSLGRTEGIGSRFFTVLNTDDSLVAQDSTLRIPQGGLSLSTLTPAGDTQLQSADRHVWGRTGFDLSAAWLDMHPRANGRYQVRLPEMGRLELWFGGAVEAGYLVAPDGSLQDLPVGSSLSGARFGWGVPVGYHGPYHLVFVRDGERIDVDVTVAPLARAEGDTEAEIRMHLDGVQGAGCAVRGAGAGCQVQLAGWAYDPRAAIESGIGAVHVWATKVQGPGSRVQGSEPFFVGEATLNVVRPDVAKAHTDAPAQAGFSLSATLAPGTYEFTAYVWNVRTARWEDARTVIGTVR